MYCWCACSALERLQSVLRDKRTTLNREGQFEVLRTEHQSGSATELPPAQLGYLLLDANHLTLQLCGPACIR